MPSFSAPSRSSRPRRWASREASDHALDAVVPPGTESVTFTATAPGPAALTLSVPGRHNALNARAALAAIELAGLDVDRAAAALESFPGMLRRQELKGEHSGAAVYDDYAHHPTEVRATLAALRELKPERLIAVFQPHLYSRTKALASDFGAALAAADEVGVLDVYAAREEPVGPLEGVSGLAVARAAADHAGGKRVMWLGDCETAARVLAPRLREGDLLVTIGAGDIFKLADDLVAAMNVEKDFPLARLTTVRAGGNAEQFARPSTEEELVELLAWASQGRPPGRGRRIGFEPPGRRCRGSLAWS